jgi:hypothetical protein
MLHGKGGRRRSPFVSQDSKQIREIAKREERPASYILERFIRACVKEFLAISNSAGKPLPLAVKCAWGTAIKCMTLHDALASANPYFLSFSGFNPMPKKRG